MQRFQSVCNASADCTTKELNRCGVPVSESTTNRVAMQSANPFSDKPEGANPYSSPTDVALPRPGSARLFLPALFLLLSSGFSALYMVATLAMVLSPEGPFSGTEFAHTRWMMIASYLSIFVISVVCAAGAIAMLRMRAKWLAWTATVLALLPLFGPCLGLTIPLGIWSLVLLRRPDVDASFS